METEKISETKSSYLARFIGQPISVLCVRYKYRGILTEVGKDYLVLSSPFAVISGDSATSETIQREDAVPSDLMVSLEFIEVVCQPIWCFNGYEGWERKAKEESVKK